GGFVVGAAGRAVGAGFGEAVHGLAEVDEDPVGVGGAHLVLETGDLLGRHVAVLGAVEHQQAGPDLAGLGRTRGEQVAVEAHRRGDVGAAAGQFQHHAAAEQKPKAARRSGSTGARSPAPRSVSRAAPARPRSTSMSAYTERTAACASSVLAGRTSLPYMSATSTT